MRLKTLRPRVQLLRAERVKKLDLTPGATPRLSDRSGHAWAKLREQVLREEPLCQCEECKATGRVRVSDEVDHIVPLALGGTDERANLRGINHGCHAKKTARERVAMR